MAQTSTLRVYVRVPQALARNVTPGHQAEISIPELPGRVFPAKVVRTSGAMSADSRTMLTELELDNSKGELLAGTYAQVRFNEANTAPALTLPANTLLFRAEGTQVGVVTPENKVELRNVSIGRDFGPSFEVVEGVKDSDRVILNPPDSLTAGASVRVVAPGTPGALAEKTK